MDFTTLDIALWATGFIGHVALLLVLVFRSRWRRFPVFTTLIAYQAAVSMALFLISRFGSPHTYLLGYWLLALGDYSFQVALIFEIGRNVLRPTGTWVSDARRSFWIWSAVSLLVAAGLSMTITPPATRGFDLWEIRATLFTSLLTCELFLSISAAANHLGLRWRSHVMALGQGLAVWAVIAVIGDVAQVATGWRREFAIFDQARMYVYLGALVFWVISFSGSEQERAPLSADMQEHILALHRRVQCDLEKSRQWGVPSL